MLNVVGISSKSNVKSKDCQNGDKQAIYDVVDSGSNSECDHEWLVNNAKIPEDFNTREQVSNYMVNGEKVTGFDISFSNMPAKRSSQKTHIIEDLSLGDLASLTVNNEGGIIICKFLRIVFINFNYLLSYCY